MTAKRATPSKSTFDPRALMERAVEVMAASIAEARSDRKPTPKVGVVLRKKDGTIEVASRGELRDGDHAEFTLLERKNRHLALDGAVLFTTLEPCAPGARKPPKRSCAERIVDARIEEVYVGIEDPDPTVDRKGIKYLQDHGVKVHLFDRDLQEVIHSENAELIEKAELRAEVARKAPPPVVLSGFEQVQAGTRFDDLDRSAIEAYRSSAGFPERVGSAGFNRRLSLQGLVLARGKQFLPTGFGLIAFGREPAIALPQARLLGTVHLADGREETRGFEGPAVLIPEQVIQWLKDKLPNPIDRTAAKRREVNAALYELVREGVVNALVHRDYGIAGAKCQLIASAEKIVVMSPGLPVPPITLEQLQSFDAPMLSRNPVLHYVFARLKLAEERGLGLKSMKSRAAAAGLPPPVYSYTAPYLVLALFLDASAAVSSRISRNLARRLTKAESAGWTWLAARDGVSSAQYREALRIPLRTAKYQLNKFAKVGLVRKVGAARASRYEVVR